MALGNLEKEVRRVLGDAKLEESKALTRAAELADEFKDIEPSPYILQLEKLIGIGVDETRPQPEKAAAWWQLTG